MSSYELINLVEFLPSDGAFMAAARGGEYSIDEQVWRHMATEISKLRATLHAVHGGERYAPIVFPTVAEMREEQGAADSVEELREDFFSFADRTEEYATDPNKSVPMIPTPRGQQPMIPTPRGQQPMVPTRRVDLADEFDDEKEMAVF